MYICLAASVAVDEISENHRKDAKLVFIIFSDGGIRNCSNSTKNTIKKLHSQNFFSFSYLRKKKTITVFFFVSRYWLV